MLRPSTVLQSAPEVLVPEHDAPFQLTGSSEFHGPPSVPPQYAEHDTAPLLRYTGVGAAVHPFVDDLAHVHCMGVPFALPQPRLEMLDDTHVEPFQVAGNSAFHGAPFEPAQ